MAQISYPAGAKVRVGQICSEPARDDKPARQGLLPINRATWYRWVKSGHVRPGEVISKHTVVWPVDYVLSLGQQEAA
jgi:hypothetical protein